MVQEFCRELIDQVFVPFFSTKEKGSGIGLSLSRQIMNNHQGSIHLDSEPGKHTRVTLVFP
jgi:two-component system nitrogen regulation sensor histidine kinase NtrY